MLGKVFNLIQSTPMKTYILTLYLLLIAPHLISQKVLVAPEVSMLALGDSYTIGESVAVNDRWPHQFISQLRALGVTADFPDYIATTGWTTRNLLGRMQSLLPNEKTYNLVSILIGVNNQYQGRDIDEYEPDLREIIDLALDLVNRDSRRVMILSIPDYAYTPFGNGFENISEEIDAYNDIKQRVAEEYEIAYIYITDISREGLVNPSLVASDGLHPSGEQYARWVQQAIVPRLLFEKSLSDREQEEMEKAAIRLYPNPSGPVLHMDGDLEIERIHIYNVMGKMVLDSGITGLPARIDVSHLESGAYMLCAYEDSFPGRFCQTLLISQGN
jgi:lysophospholipase L1-like esterase